MNLFRFKTLKNDLFIETKTSYQKCKNPSEAFNIFVEKCKDVTLEQIAKYKLGFEAVTCQRFEI